MGAGGGIFLIAVGAILAFAVHANMNWLNLQVVGWVLMLAGLAVLGLTIYFWQQRRIRTRVRPVSLVDGSMSLVEESIERHSPDRPVLPEPPDAELPPGTASGASPMV